MNKLDFAEKLNRFRLSHGLSQKQLAEKLNISNKAVSKWENAEAMPPIETLIKIAKIFNTTIDELVASCEKNKKQVYKIVITGGPCSGKSTALSWLQAEFTKKGYMVLFVPETASELILGGIAPWTIDTNLNFETYIMKLQLEKERIFEGASEHFDNYNKILIVCDRGLLDCKAYMTECEFASAMRNLGLNEVFVRDSYDAVFHLVTAANGAKEFYSLENNKARYETVEEAIEKDEKTLNAWMGHPHLRVVDNSTNFKNKMLRLVSEISGFLGEPMPYEIERKFLIEYPDIEALEKMQNCKKVEIVQTYLKAKEGEEIRIRQRGEGNYFTYTKTIKKLVSPGKRIEIENRISKDEYLKLLLDTDTTKHQIRKNIQQNMNLAGKREKKES